MEKNELTAEDFYKNPTKKVISELRGHPAWFLYPVLAALTFLASLLSVFMICEAGTKMEGLSFSQILKSHSPSFVVFTMLGASILTLLSYRVCFNFFFTALARAVLSEIDGNLKSFVAVLTDTLKRLASIITWSIASLILDAVVFVYSSFLAGVAWNYVKFFSSTVIADQGGSPSKILSLSIEMLKSGPQTVYESSKTSLIAFLFTLPGFFLFLSPFWYLTLDLTDRFPKSYVPWISAIGIVWLVVGLTIERTLKVVLSSVIYHHLAKNTAPTVRAASK